MKDVLVSQMGLRETVRKYGITHKIIETWIKIYLEKGKSYFQDEIDDGSETSPDLPATLSSVPSDGLAVSKRSSKLAVKDEERLDKKCEKS